MALDRTVGDDRKRRALFEQISSGAENRYDTRKKKSIKKFCDDPYEMDARLK